jgi:hypothetical protein
MADTPSTWNPESRATEIRSANANEATIATLLGDLIGDAQTLIRKEFELARHEVTVEVDKARQGAINLGIGGGILAVGALFLLLMIVHILHEVVTMPLWLAYLVVGGVLAIIGGILLIIGKNRLEQVDPMPRETIESVRKDVEWLKEQNPSDKI